MTQPSTPMTQAIRQGAYAMTRVTASEYEGLFAPFCHIYDSADFCELNRHKADSMHYLVVSDTKARFGIVLGERGGRLLSPFSAPFGGFTTNRAQRLEGMEAATELLTSYARGLGLTWRITLPPLAYDCTQLSKWANVLGRMGRLLYSDLNYHMPLHAGTDYMDIITSGARNKLRGAMRHGMELHKLRGDCRDDIARAYAVIRQNREEHGYPLRMSLDDVVATAPVARADFFVLTHEGTDVAAAQIHNVATGIAQVIYWGDIAAASALHPMNLLAALLYRHYADAGYRMLDIGPSTEDGVPNYGLCAFKEDTGCYVSPKLVFGSL